MPARNFKYGAVKRLLDQHRFIMVHVNTSVAGVNLPSHLGKAPTVTLKISNEFRGSLELTTEEIVAELLFGDDYYTCHLPFSAIWAVGTPEGQVQFWGDSSPAEILEQFTAADNASAASHNEDNKRDDKKKTHLRRIK